jgi:hypothetical protein
VTFAHFALFPASILVQMPGTSPMTRIASTQSSPSRAGTSERRAAAQRSRPCGGSPTSCLRSPFAVMCYRLCASQSANSLQHLGPCLLVEGALVERKADHPSPMQPSCQHPRPKAGWLTAAMPCHVVCRAGWSWRATCRARGAGWPPRPALPALSSLAATPTPMSGWGTCTCWTCTAERSWACTAERSWAYRAEPGWACCS